MAPALSCIPPQYTPGSIVIGALAEKLLALQPEKKGTETFEYGSEIRERPVATPCVAVIEFLLEMPPTTPTYKADSVAEPPRVSAVVLLELSYMLQFFRLMLVFPPMEIDPLALALSASTQALAPYDFATAVADILRLENPIIRMMAVFIEPVADTVTELSCELY